MNRNRIAAGHVRIGSIGLLLLFAIRAYAAPNLPSETVDVTTPGSTTRSALVKAAPWSTTTDLAAVGANSTGAVDGAGDIASSNPLLAGAEAVGQRLVALAWSPPESGVPTSYILEAGTTPGASNVFNGNIALTTTIASVIGPGTYYVRVRAVNAAGVSPPSNEVVLAVGSGAPGQPTVTSANATGGILTVSWESSTGPTPTSHRLDFYSAAGLVATVSNGAGTSITTPISPWTTGTFGVRVTPYNATIAGPASALFTFTIDSSCNPPASPDVSGRVMSGTASVSWPAVPGAASYILSAGSTQGGTQYLRATNIGANTTASARVASSFTAWVRVIAVDACGQQSAPRDFLVQ